MGANASRLALAAWMAERGELHAALLLVQDAEDAGDAHAASRMRAKLFAAAGHHGEAAGAWQRVLEMAPEDGEAKKGLSVAKRLAASPFLAWLVKPRRLIFVLCGATAMLVIAVMLVWPRGPTALERVEASLARVEAGSVVLRSSADRFHEQLTAITDRLRTLQSGVAVLDQVEASQNELRGTTEKLTNSLTEVRAEQVADGSKLKAQLDAIAVQIGELRVGFTVTTQAQADLKAQVAAVQAAVTQIGEAILPKSAERVPPDLGSTSSGRPITPESGGNEVKPP